MKLQYNNQLISLVVVISLEVKYLYPQTSEVMDSHNLIRFDSSLASC